MIENEWERAFDRAVPLLGAGLGAVSLVIGIMTLLRSSPLGQRVYYQDGRYLVSVRFPGQWHDLREFIQPDNPEVVAVYSQIGPDAWQLLDFVCRHVSYKSDVGEHWQFPSETLARGQGDCEDSALLTCSLLKNFNDGYVALGSYQGYGHAWCQVDGQILETTYTRAQPVPDPEHYTSYCLFNDREVIELWPGALGEVFELGRNEVAKLNLMAEAIGNEAPPECPSCWPVLLVGLATGGILGTGFAMILQKGEYKG